MADAAAAVEADNSDAMQEAHEAAEIYWQRLSADLYERILARLPISVSIRFASVCKDWYSRMSAPAFSVQIRDLAPGRKPWLFLWGSLPRSQTCMSCMYDPMVGRWFLLPSPALRPPLANAISHTLISGSFQGLWILCPDLSTPQHPAYGLHYFALKPSPHNTSAVLSRLPRFLGRFPIVGALNSGSGMNDDSNSSSSSSSNIDIDRIDSNINNGNIKSNMNTDMNNNIHINRPPHPFRFFILGEARINKTAPLYLYNSHTGKWEQCEPFPRDTFLGAYGSYNASYAVVGNTIYIAGISSNAIASFNVDRKAWSTVSYFNVPDAMYVLIASIDKSIYAIGICTQNGLDRCLKLFKVDECSMKCKEVSRMPDHMWSLFGDHPKLHLTRLKCVGSGHLLYLYYGSFFHNIRICVCDVDADYKWEQLPSLPFALQDCDAKVECCSIDLSPMACLTSLFR